MKTLHVKRKFIRVQLCVSSRKSLMFRFAHIVRLICLLLLSGPNAVNVKPLSWANLRINGDLQYQCDNFPPLETTLSYESLLIWARTTNNIMAIGFLCCKCPYLGWVMNPL